MPCSDYRDNEPCDHSGLIKRLDRATRVACELAKLVDKKHLDKLSREAIDWITEHEIADAKREKEEKAAARKAEMKKKALAKLSPAERIILGLQ